MENTYEKILGKEASQFIPIINKILSEVKNHKYHFMNESEFTSLTQTSPSEGQSQYMKELLYRANFGSLSAIAKNYEWLRGMHNSYEAGLYLPFSSSFRCLIESVADSYFSLSNLCTTLSKNIKDINISINQNSPNFHIYTDLENQLIHYSHARRLNSGESAPDSHKAETAARYVKMLDEETSSDFYDCYSELCQLSHPAAQGVLHMMIPINDQNFIFEHKFGKEKIDAFLEKQRDKFSALLTFAFNPSILALKVINHIQLNELHVEPVNELNMDHIVAWQKCKQDIIQAGI
ncbi:hypothetical protein RB215_13820 [Pseudoalteromonas sp. HL-AS2]|jgi:hypothetical protein|uniref:hypothetical protein n=1 Tax=unclassified Pseudoalteromonas TaxID=194690 RepID=UPI0001EF8DCE|nr:MULTISPECIES: hypothetical protein [unclassified Pseudoalteromonas]ADT69834.1 conserved hypothetical protein [Pseudoalteromonas sp. SM9913]WMS94318.1 hypothetical protein RB215_13820 [Pseudoalteromonas sp. HL-AS2]